MLGLNVSKVSAGKRCPGLRRSVAALSVRTVLAAAVVVTAALAFLPAASGCQKPAVDQRIADWRSDLRYLAKKLPARHADFAAAVNRADFDVAVQSLDAAIPTLSDTEIKIGLARIVAMLHDAHTSLWLYARWDERAAGFPVYPLELRMFDDGLYVVRTTPEYSEALGARLVAIGDTDIQQVWAKVAEVIPAENEFWLQYVGPGQMVVPELLDGLGILPDPSKGRYVFADAATGETFALELSPVPAASNPGLLSVLGDRGVPLYEQAQGEDYWFTYLPESKTVYVKYNRCVDTERRFQEFLNNLIELWNQKPVERFVVDLRGNTGGNSMVLQPLIQALAGSEVDREGRLFVAIDKVTFSSGMLNAVELRQRTKAILVGEPTGGAPWSFGEVKAFTLPKSRLRIQYSVKTFHLTPSRERTVMPDIFVPVTFADYAAGRDPVLETILAYGSAQAQAGREALARQRAAVPEDFEVKISYYPATLRFIVGCRMTFRCREPLDALTFAVPRNAEVQAIETAASVRQVPGDEVWAVYRLDGPWRAGDSLSVELRYGLARWTVGPSAPYWCDVAADGAWVPGCAWLPRPAAQVEGRTFIGEAFGGPASASVEFEVPGGWAALVPGMQSAGEPVPADGGRIVYRFGTSTGLAATAQWPIGWIAAPYDRVSGVSAGVPYDIWIPKALPGAVSDAGETERLAAVVPGALSFLAEVLGPLPSQGIQVIEIPPCSGAAWIQPGAAVFSAHGWRASGEDLEQSVAGRLAAAVGVPIAGDEGLAAFLGDYYLLWAASRPATATGGLAYEEAAVRRRAYFGLAYGRWGDITVADAAAMVAAGKLLQDREAYLESRPALFWHMFRAYYGDQAVLEVVRSARERYSAPAPVGSEAEASLEGWFDFMSGLAAEVGGPEAGRLYDYWFRTGRSVDLAVELAEARRLPREETGEQPWLVTVTIRDRRQAEESPANAIIPWVDFVVRSEDGQQTTVTRVDLPVDVAQFEVVVPGRPGTVLLDPDALIPDTDPANNTWAVKVVPSLGEEAFYFLPVWLSLAALVVYGFLRRRVPKTVAAPPKAGQAR